MTPEAAARRWADTWRSEWERLDAEPIVALYDVDAVVSTAPFGDPTDHHGVRDYVTRAFGEEEDPRVAVGDPIVDNDRAAIAWWASLREEGADTTLAGTSLLRFTADGLVAEQWDTWNTIPERHDPPPRWAPGSRAVERSWTPPTGAFSPVWHDDGARVMPSSDDAPNGDFDDLDGDVTAALGTWRTECEQSRRIVAAAASLEETGIRRSTGEPISLRAILVLMLAEYARHNDHADLLRERIDGATGT